MAVFPPISETQYVFTTKKRPPGHPAQSADLTGGDGDILRTSMDSSEVRWGPLGAPTTAES